MGETSCAPMKHLGAEAEKKSTDPVSKKALHPKSQLLQKRDSGYNSPVTPGTTPDNATKTKTLHLGVQALRSNSSPSDGTESVMPPKPKQLLKRQLSSPGALDASQTDPRFLHSAGGSVQFSQQAQRMMLGQQELVRQASFTCDGSSVLFLAYKCKYLNPLAWKDCKHPYCVMVRNNLTHMRTCFIGPGECKRCQQFENQMYRHAEECTLAVCPVDMCQNIKQQLQQELGSLPYDHDNPLNPHSLQRWNSFGGLDQNYGNSNQSSLLLSLSQITSGNISDDSPAARYIGARADEIVDKLDREEPLLSPEPSSAAPPTSLGRPGSLRANAAQSEDYQVLNILSPIAERSEDMSPSSFGGPHLLGGHSMQSLSLMSSYEQDGLNKSSKTAPSMGGPNSLVLEGEEDKTVYPEQEVMHKFKDDYLTLGKDGHYYQLRDYNANDSQITGGFGTVRFAEDLATKHLFAIKCNNKDDDSLIEAMETEARLLSKLKPHINVIQMYGAVFDREEQDFLPTRMFKLLMELSQHGNLTEMVEDPDTKQPYPLERDQALFYFWQVLKGVDFLHRNNILHLDIKGSNILVFDEGRTLKICDFGTAVHMDEIASKVGKNLGTLQFSAPEICRQEMPHFSSDMWSTMCVLVEMLTGQKPWECDSNSANNLIYKIGNYSDNQMESDLIPRTPGVEIDSDVMDMMRLVFLAEGKARVSASDLLYDPLVVNAFMYEECFDEVLDSTEDYASIDLCAPTSLSLQPEEPMHLREDCTCLPCLDLKRLSKDSGTGQDLEQEMSCQYGRMPSSGRNSDSGLDTPYTADRQILSSIGKSMFPFPEENSAEMMDTDNEAVDRAILRPHLLIPLTPSEGNCISLPNPVLQSDPIIQVQRSYSLTLPGSHSPSSPYHTHAQIGSNRGNVTQIQQHQYPYSYSRLRHSNSAPVIGGQYCRRRHSLQSLHSYGSEDNTGKLRRISSEIYVDRGPDIDSPDRVRVLDVSSWAQDVQKELLHTQRSEEEYEHLTTGHTPSTDVDDGLNCNSSITSTPLSADVQGSHRGHEVDGEGCGVQVVSGDSEEASRTEVEKHVTMQGRTFETYKTVC